MTTLRWVGCVVVAPLGIMRMRGCVRTRIRACTHSPPHPAHHMPAQIAPPAHSSYVGMISPTPTPPHARTSFPEVKELINASRSLGLSFSARASNTATPSSRRRNASSSQTVLTGCRGEPTRGMSSEVARACEIVAVCTSEAAAARDKRVLWELPTPRKEC